MTLPVHLAPGLSGARTGDVVEVEGDEARHAVVVRRLRVGEPVALTDGAGTRATGTVASTGPRRLGVLLDAVETAPRAVPSVTVVQALPKGDRGERAVELLTEVGVDTIVPWAAARCVASWRGERGTRSLARWRTTAREAAKQSRRSWFPVVRESATTREVAGLVAAAELAVVLHEEAAGSLAEVLGAAEALVAAEVLVVVGPEGGLTAEEVAAFVAAGGRVVRLGPEVLRTSTAGLAAVAALLARTPRWR